MEWPGPIETLFRKFKLVNTHVTFLAAYSRHTLPTFEHIVKLNDDISRVDLQMFKDLFPVGDIFFDYVDENDLLLGEKVVLKDHRYQQSQPRSVDDAYETVLAGSTEKHEKQLLIFEFRDARTHSIGLKMKNSRWKKKQPAEVFTLLRLILLELLSLEQLQGIIASRNQTFVSRMNGFLAEFTAEEVADHVPFKRLVERLNPAVPEPAHLKNTDELLEQALVVASGDKPDADAMIAALREPVIYKNQITTVDILTPARPARFRPLPELLRPELADALWAYKGIDTALLYTHQAEAVEAVLGHSHVIVSTSTSSGKLLIYQLPVLNAILESADTTKRTATALFIFPTKALAQDQKRHLLELISHIHTKRRIIVDTYDGDTPLKDRPFIRNHADIIFTNPDAIHAAILPKQATEPDESRGWSDFLHHLRFVVIDELHVYKGTFGVHVLYVMARLNRVVCRLQENRPVYILCSATIRNPELHFRAVCALGSESVVHVSDDGSPLAQKTLVVWDPPVLMNKHGKLAQSRIEITPQSQRKPQIQLEDQKSENSESERPKKQPKLDIDPVLQHIHNSQSGLQGELQKKEQNSSIQWGEPDSRTFGDTTISEGVSGSQQNNNKTSRTEKANKTDTNGLETYQLQLQGMSEAEQGKKLKPQLPLMYLPRESPVGESSKILVHLLSRFPSIKIILFCPIREVCELVIKEVRHLINLKENPQWSTLSEHDVMAYRGGYGKSDRRAIEQKMFNGQLRAIVATNALELGIDLSDLDVVICCGFPTLKLNLHQQFGRAGRLRSSKGLLAVLICGNNPLDRYFLQNPQEIVETSYEDLCVEGIMDGSLNRVVLLMHLQCAAFEWPIDVDSDMKWFLPRNLPKMNTTFTQLCQDVLHKDNLGRFRTDPRYLPWPPEKVSLRAVDDQMFAVVDVTKNRNVVIEEVEAQRTSFTLYEGAIFLHQGLPFLVKEFNFDQQYAKVERVHVTWVTRQRDFTDVDPYEIEAVKRLKLPLGDLDVPVFFGKIRLTIIVFGYFKVDRLGQILEAVEVKNPPITLHSKGFWVDIPGFAIAAVKSKNLSPAGGIHAAQHAIMNTLPLFITGGATTNPNARWLSAIGELELSTECKSPEKEFAKRQSARKRPARLIFHDSKGGTNGTGIAAKTFEFIDKIIHTTFQRVLQCPCEWGCPLCVTGHFCLEQMLVMLKPAAVIILGALLGMDVEELKEMVVDGPEANMPEISVETVSSELQHVRFSRDVEITS